MKDKPEIDGLEAARLLYAPLGDDKAEKPVEIPSPLDRHGELMGELARVVQIVTDLSQKVDQALNSR